MSVKVLHSHAEIEKSRFVMDDRKISCLSTRESKTDEFLKKIQRKLRIGKPSDAIAVGDVLKSWDVLLTIEFIEERFKNNASILDIGAFASEVICSLHKIGYKNLFAVDLNQKVKKMPFSDNINYVISDFMHTPFPNDFFDVVTATSVIEHDFKPDSLLREMSRLIKKGGYFIASTDYWQDKIDTKNQRIFDMDWLIFSEKEIRDFINLAKKYGFSMEGEADFNVKDKVIHCMNQNYTFIWLSLKKD